MKKQVYNPYLPSGEYVPDGEPHVFEDRLYIFGSHDRFGSNAYCDNDYVCYSAPVDDLSSWKYEGIIYKRNQDPLNQDGKLQLWAPDVTKGEDGRYYLYYCFAFYSAIGVAVSDKPAGPYEFYGHVKYEDGTIYGKRKGDIMPFDPAVLNDEGDIYVYSNFSPDLNTFLPGKIGEDYRAGKITADEAMDQVGAIVGNPNFRMTGQGSTVLHLEEDMITVKTAKLMIPGVDNSAGTGFEGHEFYEASSIRKIGQKYYFVYSSVLSHELAYAVSNQPDGGFVYGGAIISNGDIGYQGLDADHRVTYTGNNHGGMAEVNGQWYIFYHRQTNQNEQTRQGCAEPITIKEDGSIDQVEVTSCGLNGGPLEAVGTYPAYICCNLMGKDGARKFTVGEKEEDAENMYEQHPYITQDVEDIENPNGTIVQYIKNMKDGAQAGFKYFMMNDVQELSVTVRGDAGSFIVKDKLDGETLGKISWNSSREYHSASAKISFPYGKRALYFEYVGSGAVDFKDFTFA